MREGLRVQNDGWVWENPCMPYGSFTALLNEPGATR